MKRSTLALCIALGLFAFLWVQVSAQTGTPRRPIVRTDRDADLLFEDTFDDPASGWDTAASLAGAIIYQDGALAIISQREGDLMWSQLQRNFTDTLIVVDAVQVSDPAHQNNAHGVACRVQPDGISAYTVLVSGAGAFAIVRTGANQGGTLVDWTTSDAIHTRGQTNQIAVTCAGNTIELSINGIEVAKVTDDTLEAGGIALLANSFDDNPLEVHFDNLKVSVAEVRPAATVRTLSIQPPVVAEASPLQEAEIVTVSHDLDQYASFHLQHRLVFTPDAPSALPASRSITRTIAYNGEAQAQYSLVTQGLEEEALPDYAISQIDGTEYIGWPDLGCVTGIISDTLTPAGEPFYARYYVPSPYLDWVRDLERVAETVINGVDAIEYAVPEEVLADILLITPPSESAADGAGPKARLAGSLFVDADHGRLVRLTAAGYGSVSSVPLELDDQEGEFAIQYDVSNINMPVAVAVPDLCQELAAGILFRDDFGDEDAVWNTSSDDKRSKYYENDEYVMEVKVEEWTTWSWGTTEQFLDFTVEADVRMVDGPETAGYGVFVRQVDNDNYLSILIDPRGYYKISRKQNGYWKAIPDSQRTFSSAILTGTASNRLKVVGEGEEVALFVNDQHLTTIRDDFPAAGRAGLVVETTSLPEPPAKVAFDNFLIAKPEAFPPAEETGKPGVLYSHDFNTQEDWTESFDDSRDRYYEDGEYVVHIKKPGYLAWAWGLGNTRYDDFTLEADMRATEGAPEGSYGLFFRQIDNDNFYYLRLNGNGEYSLHKRVDGEYNPVGAEGWTASPHILTGGEVNRLRVTAVGPLLALYVNGQHLTSVVDDALTLGRAGIIVRSPSESAPFTAAFDNILITEPVPDEDALTLKPRPNGDLLFEDDFDEGTGGAKALFGEEWMAFAYEDGLGRVSTTGSGVRPVMYEAQEFGDFYAEFDFRDGSPGQSVRYGVVLRSEAPEDGLDHYYLIAVRPSDGLLGFSLFAGGEWATSHWFDLPEDLLTVDELNHVRIEMVGGLIIIFVNDHFAGVVTDDTIGEPGYIGLAISAGSDMEEDAEVVGYFDNFRVYAPAEPGSAPQSEATPVPTAVAAQESAEMPAIGQAVAVVSSPALNVRSGPGVNFGRVGTVKQGDELPVTGRNANCTWLKVEAADGVGWLSNGYVTLQQECSLLPVVEVTAPVATPVPTKQSETQVAAAATPVPTATSVTVAQAATPGLITGFEQFGTWRRGDEAWGEFARSADQVQSGNWAGKITYDFPANVPDDKNYVVFMRSVPIPGQPTALTMQVYGDGSGNFLNVWIKDAAGQLWQFAFGRIYHTGWQQMTASLNPNLDWPVQPIGGTATKLTYPLSFQALVLDYPTSDAHAGAIYVDDLAAK